MNYSRKPDDLVARMAHNQAWIFEKASRDGLPSYSFIKMYMCSPLVDELDRLILVPDDEICYPIYQTIKRKGTVVDPNVMHWIGYVYRYLAYLYGVSSRVLFHEVQPKYLYEVYEPYHSLDIVKAAEKIYEEKLYSPETNTERALRILRSIKSDCIQ